MHNFLGHVFYTLLGIFLCISVAVANQRGTTLGQLLNGGTSSGRTAMFYGGHSFGGGVHHK